MMRKKTAIILFNLGGPDNQAAIQPFLFNLFNDPSIIRLPNFIRPMLARFIAWRRAPKVAPNYQKMGGGSPLLPNTQAQATALEQLLAGDESRDFKCFIAMRYWHPFADAAAAAVRDWGAEEIILLPLYPQLSSSTSNSSLKDWRRACDKIGLNAPTRLVCCYPTETGFIQANLDLIQKRLAEAAQHGTPRLLLSAHGIPEKYVRDGDPYQWQCEQSAAAIMAGLPGVDAVLCYQSRVGPLKWIGPATEEVIIETARAKRPIVIAPIAFVSEHIETLIELDDEYREIAEHEGVPYYGTVPAVGVHPEFIAGLARVVLLNLRGSDKICHHQPGRLCPTAFSNCPHHLVEGKSHVL